MIPVLIDGNNLMYAVWEAEPERPMGRALLCRTLGDWARKTGASVRLVFDGPRPPAELEKQISDPGVEVIYSARESADDILVSLIQRESAPRRLRVVSSDRAIASAARRRDARTVRSADFWRRVRSDLQREPSTPLDPPEKHGEPPSPADREHWLREWGFDSEP